MVPHQTLCIKVSAILSLQLVRAHPSPRLREKNDFTLTSRQRNERMNHTFLFGAVISHSLLERRAGAESSHLCCQNLKCSESLQIVSHPLVYLLGEKSPHISRRLLTRTRCSSSEHSKWSCDTFIRQELRESPVPILWRFADIWSCGMFWPLMQLFIFHYNLYFFLDFCLLRK